MTADDRFDQDLRAWLHGAAPSTGPAGLHSGAIERARGLRQHPGWVVAVRGGTVGRASRIAGWLPRPAYVLGIVALLVTAMVAALLIGAYRSPSPLGRNGAIYFYWQGNDHSGNGSTFIDADGNAKKTQAHGCSSFSDDGRYLIYEQGESDTRLVLDPMDGTPVTKVPMTFVHHGIEFQSYDLSPDSERVAWLKPGRRVSTTPAADGSTSEIETGNEVWVSPVAGGDAVVIAPAPETGLETYWQPRWSPDGSRVAFLAHGSDLVDNEFIYLGTTIVIANADGSGVRRLEGHRAIGDTVEWSPDGRHLAYIGIPDGSTDPNGPGDIFVIGADGTGRTNLTASPMRESEPAWSPDGTAIAFLADDDQTSRITIVPMTGGSSAGPSIIGPGTGLFAWAPDATRLLYVEGRAVPPPREGATGGSIIQLRTVDRAFQEAPSAGFGEVEEATVLCHLAWQRLS